MKKKDVRVVLWGCYMNTSSSLELREKPAKAQHHVVLDRNIPYVAPRLQLEAPNRSRKFSIWLLTPHPINSFARSCATGKEPSEAYRSHRPGQQIHRKLLSALFPYSNHNSSG